MHTVSIRYFDLEAAFEWASTDAGFALRAYISKTDGRTYHTGADYRPPDEKLPEDLDDPQQYWSVPNKRDLDLGNRLALRYVEQALPEDLEDVYDFFRHRGAWGRFRDLIERRGHLKAWYAFSENATRSALLEWAKEEGLQVIEVPPPR